MGNKTYATESMKVLMRMKEGGRLTASALEADTATLYRFFQEVRIEQTPVAGGVSLRITVSENPLVKELVINGLEAMKEAEVKALPIRTRLGYPWYPRDQDLDREDIAAAYRKKGFHYADVTATATELPAGGMRVVFTVVEGPKVEVDRVVLRGNESIPRKKILEVIQTKEPWWFLDTKLYVEDELMADLVEVRKLYQSEGFLDAEVVLESQRVSDDRSRVVVTIAITEGERYRVGKISFEQVTGEPERSEDRRDLMGPGAMPPDDVAWFSEPNLREWLGLREGDWWSGKVETKGRERIREEYYRRSYLDAVVRPAMRSPRSAGRVVDVKVRIEEGRKQRVAAVVIYGNEFTRDKIIRREIHQEPGGYVDRNELDRGLARLHQTTYFTRVTRRIEDVKGPDGRSIPDLKEVVYEVQEDKTGKLRLGVSMTTDGGLGAFVIFEKRNFDIARPPRSWDDLVSGRAMTGAGQTFKVNISPSTVTSSFGVEFGEPRMFGSKWGMTLGLQRQFSYRESYTEDHMGYDVRLSHPLYEARDDSKSLEGFVDWHHELMTLDDIRSTAVPGVFLFQGEHEIRSLGGGIRYRTVDDAAKPGHKTATTLGFEVAGGPLGGDIDWWKLRLVHEQRFVLSEDSEGRRRFLTARINGGIAGAFDDTPEVPPFARFYLGGNEFRGFRVRGVGPHSNGRPMGGEFVLAGTLEYEHPLVTGLLAGVAFVDAGTLGTSIDSDDALLPRVSVGFGVRLTIAAFGPTPLAVDFGFPLLKQEEDETTLLSFSLTRTF